MAISRSVRITRRSVRVGGGLLDRAGLVTTIQGLTGDATFSTFTAADDTPPADETPTTLTFTLRDANDDPIAGASVTYA